MRKVCVVTGTRAEYGLLYSLMKELESSENIRLQLIVTGMHLSPEFGYTFSDVEKVFSISKKIEILLSSDTAIGISKSMGLAQISFSEAYDELKPDIVVLLGDRFELFSAAAAAMIACIPIAHIHGGEITEGAFDDSIRHCITKMSHLHFVTTDEYRRRVVQLGESPERVFNCGAPGLDAIKNSNLFEREELEREIDFRFGQKNLLVTFHPVTLEPGMAGAQFQEILSALDELSDTHIIFTKANADTGGRLINKMIDDYVADNVGKSVAFQSLGQLRYLSTLKYVDGVVGNSSSGLIEAPSFKVGTVNIGHRQSGRVKAASVIDCSADRDSILDAITKLYSPDFQKNLKLVVNPYGDGGGSKLIAAHLERISLEKLIKKTFFDFSS